MNFGLRYFLKFFFAHSEMGRSSRGSISSAHNSSIDESSQEEHKSTKFQRTLLMSGMIKKPGTVIGTQNSPEKTVLEKTVLEKNSPRKNIPRKTVLGKQSSKEQY